MTVNSINASEFATTLITSTAHLAAAGIGPALVVLLAADPGEPRWSAAVTRYAVLTAMVAGAGAAVVLAVPAFSGRYPALHHPAVAACLLGAIPAYAVGAMTDYAFVSLHRSAGMLWRNIAFSVGKIGILLICVSVGRASVLAVTGAWTVAALLSVAVAAAQIRWWKPGACLRLRCVGLPLRPAISLAARQHMVTLSGSVTPFVIPVLITAIRSDSYSHFFIPWMAGQAIFIIPTAAATAAMAEIAAQPDRVREHVRHAALLSAAISTACVALAALLGPLVLASFGRSYASAVYWLLVTLAASAIPGSVTTAAVATWRATGKPFAATALELGMAASECALVAILAPRMGIIAVGIALGVVRAAAATVITVTWVFEPSFMRDRLHCR